MCYSPVLLELHYIKPLPILTEGSVVHPGAIGKKAGCNWPIFLEHQMLLRKVLPILFRAHHAIAFYDQSGHATMDDMSIGIYNDLNKLVS